MKRRHLGGDVMSVPTFDDLYVGETSDGNCAVYCDQCGEQVTSGDESTINVSDVLEAAVYHIDEHRTDAET